MTGSPGRDTIEHRRAGFPSSVPAPSAQTKDHAPEVPSRTAQPPLKKFSETVRFDSPTAFKACPRGRPLRKRRRRQMNFRLVPAAYGAQRSVTSAASAPRILRRRHSGSRYAPPVCMRPNRRGTRRPTSLAALFFLRLPKSKPNTPCRFVQTADFFRKPLTNLLTKC